ncbi:hypothetical protein VHUM_03351 [Vanrija humicola]|uniref:3-oxo-5-alpha-steroid 4-dehydrogenase C-terminal domain-containing protein n=1 Tax=Vanrija humicola TaxID=5417 RepID=A0A7D8YXW2_VANHU|nr:hypothetical protein VHUM_03351 [Vanrija humicola]
MAPPQPSALYHGLLAAFHVFPVHAPLTLWVFDAPFGKFARNVWGNVDGNKAWVVMEAVAPATFLATLAAIGAPQGRPAALLAGLYLLHYLHRAFVSPLLLAPPRAPLHAVVVAAGIVFNLLNASLLARTLVYFPPTGGWAFRVGVVLWLVGFAGNVYHDEILHDLRRPPGHRLVSPQIDAPTRKSAAGGGRYKVPSGGLFALVSFPNYLCEWLEWTGYAIALSPHVLTRTPLFPGVMLAAPWAFVLAEVTAMMPRAVRGHAWYRRTFSDYPAERRAVVPWVI